MAISASIGLSGLQAAQLRLNASAHNIANAVNESAVGQQVVLEVQPGGGVLAAIVPSSAPPDLASDVVEQMAASRAYLANLSVVTAADARERGLIDTVAHAPPGFR